LDKGEELDTVTPIKKKSDKIQKGKFTLRGRINDIAAELGNVAGPNLDVQKRKAGPDTGPDAR
jgi:hypothetical protein